MFICVRGKSIQIFLNIILIRDSEEPDRHKDEKK